MTRTGVYVTEDERAKVAAGASSPAMALQCGPPPSIHPLLAQLAEAHGLPPLEGRYGMDLKTGEFLAP